MRYLIDTHAFLWFVNNDSMLSEGAKQIITNESNDIFLSDASVWEMAIKVSMGRLKFNETFEIFVPRQLEVNRFALLNISTSHIMRVANMPFHHKDPFDRLLIAQSIVEQMPMISRDPVFKNYGINQIW